MMTVETAKTIVAESGLKLLESKLVARTWGNVSCRTGDKTFVITPSGLSYEQMTAADIVVYDAESGNWEGSRKPSSEKGVHAAAYAQFPDAGFVIHTHQMYASAIGLAGFDRLKLTDEEEAALGGIALSKYGLPGSKKLMKNVKASLATGAHAILMAQHGALIVGKDEKEAFERAMKLEEVCKAACHGQPSTSGQPTQVSEGSALKAIVDSLAPSFQYLAYTSHPATIRTSQASAVIEAQLDDMAQMIGPKLYAVPASAEAVGKALETQDAVLVKNLGAVCKAVDKADGDALTLLTEKACVAYLHTHALGDFVNLSWLDANLMRFVYLKKYSKKSGG
ncbi:class II aldolase/adducin family protein [Fusibacter paucivorans]|uniref:L-ribulose-5-phosphate 4-epimerase n=1 Tax=Fusibacter paucivorans TaxID=76009 RepID=A0ABS5PLV2_9FIRM|nr:class II aldolase/adducin family protein [Fusibacter paucivorans]MBS7526149.1 class II aldolase/adducin family protein [Fusibacter paucivorans]